MLPYAKTGCPGGPEGCATASGVKSSRIRCKEAAALMPRKNLLSLFADFARFGGAVAVPMDSAASPDFVQRAIHDAGVKLILRDRQQRELPGAPPSIIINDFEDVVDSPAPAADGGVDPGEASTRSTVAEILYTSGTTAEPRGVVLTHGNFLANLEPLERGIAAYR